jgi:hypothetical protein
MRSSVQPWDYVRSTTISPHVGVAGGTKLSARRVVPRPYDVCIAEADAWFRDRFPDVECVPLVRTLAAVSRELGVSAWELRKRVSRNTLWQRGEDYYVPPDIYESWRRRAERERERQRKRQQRRQR